MKCIGRIGGRLQGAPVLSLDPAAIEVPRSLVVSQMVISFSYVRHVQPLQFPRRVFSGMCSRMLDAESTAVFSRRSGFVHDFIISG